MIWVGQRKATTKRKNNQPFSFRKLSQKHPEEDEGVHTQQLAELETCKLHLWGGWVVCFGEGLVCLGGVCCLVGFFRLAVLHSGYHVSVWAPGSLHAILRSQEGWEALRAV